MVNEVLTGVRVLKSRQSLRATAKPFEKMQKKLPPEAQRALAEAEARRLKNKNIMPATEVNGVKGLEPTRYGDWEKKGLTSDF